MVASTLRQAPGRFEPSLSHRFIRELETREQLLHNYSGNIDAPEYDASACCEACLADPACTGFGVWYGKCYLKASSTAAPAPNGVAYLLASRKPTPHPPPPASSPPPPARSPLAPIYGGSLTCCSRGTGQGSVG